MHIPDGILPASVCIAGYGLTGIATWNSLRKIKLKDNPRKDIPKASLITAAFFVASWIHIPIPPSSVHLMLTGLLGALVGQYAFPAIIISLFFQAIMFQHGGLTTIGVNALALGVPALISHYLNQICRKLANDSSIKNGILGFIIGAVGIGLSVLIYFFILTNFIPINLDAEAEKAAIYVLAVSHLPLMLIEGAFTSLMFIYLKRVKPEILECS